MYAQKQIEKIAQIANDYMLKANRLIDMRTLRDKKVKAWAYRNDLIEQREDGRWYYAVRPDCGKIAAILPIEVLWYILKPAIERNPSYRICNAREWLAVGVDTDDLTENYDQHRVKVWILDLLEKAGYIRFRRAGSLWIIDIL